MTFHIVTIFPELFKTYLGSSILARAIARGALKVKLYNLRDFTADKHHKVDDKPYGGGPGMVIGLPALVRALAHILRGKPKNKTRVIITTPGGKQFTNKKAATMACSYRHIVIITGRYEGLDARLGEVIRRSMGVGAEELSSGPYVLTGGELPALIIVDTVSRHLKGVLGKEESLEENRYGIGLPVYTRPEVFCYRKNRYRVPGALLSGNHKKIDTWRRGKTRRRA